MNNEQNERFHVITTGKRSKYNIKSYTKAQIKFHAYLNVLVLGAAILSTHAIAYTNFDNSEYVGLSSWSG